jgi:hypothetical protein
MNLLKEIVEGIEQGTFYDWTRDFDVFKNTLNSATETSKSRFEKALSGKVINKSVLVRASKGYKQPIKDYDIKRVTAVNINDFYDDWVVVLKNEFNKEFFLTAGYKIKIMGAAVAAEPGSAEVPQQEPQQPTQQQKTPAKPLAPKPSVPGAGGGIQLPKNAGQKSAYREAIESQES